MTSPPDDRCRERACSVRGAARAAPRRARAGATASCSPARSTRRSSSGWTRGARCGSGRPAARRRPMPRDVARPRSRRELTAASSRRSSERFFHWELEFPDVFRSDARRVRRRARQPAVGDCASPNSQEFFSRHDPLYRTYGKTDALRSQQETVRRDRRPRGRSGSRYQGGFKAMANLRKAAASPFDVSLGTRRRWRDRWPAAGSIARAQASHLAHRGQPFRLQGSADLYTYKLFVEAAHHLLRDGGRLGMLVPSGIYTDQGTTELRKTFLRALLMGVVLRIREPARALPDPSRYKFVPIVVERGGVRPTPSNAAFMRHDVTEWERPDEQRFSSRVQTSIASLRRPVVHGAEGRPRPGHLPTGSTPIIAARRVVGRRWWHATRASST